MSSNRLEAWARLRPGNRRFLLAGDHKRPNAQYGNTPFLVGGVIIAFAFGLATTLRRSEPATAGVPSPVGADKK